MALTATMEGGDNSDFGGDDGYDRDLILSRDEFEMLHALHRFVPLPALSSNILRIVCDHDLEVTREEEDATDAEDEGSDGDKTVASTPKRGNNGGTMRTTTNIASTHSPLTRRLSHRHSKPLLEIDLTPQHQTQYQKKRHGVESTSSNASTSTNTSHNQQSNNARSTHGFVNTDEQPRERTE